jgi:hypothetical protein
MKKAFVITSAIDVQKDAPLTYSSVRSHFEPDERFRQTVSTIANLDARFPKDTVLFLVDLSEDYEKYRGILSYQKNLVFISVKEQFPEIYDIVRTHPNKSHCETLLLLKFFAKYKEQLKEFDYFFKVSGRYFVDGSFGDELLIPENRDKIFFKHPMQFDWQDLWNYHRVDRRAIQKDNKLRQYCSVLYGFGKEHYDRFVDLYRVLSYFTNHPAYATFDVETLLYFFTRDFEKDIIEVDWLVYGYNGADGNFLRY